MMNTNLIESAVNIVVNFFEAEGINENTSTIRERVTEWYNKTDITDAELLAAAAITGHYEIGITLDDIISYAKFYFTSCNDKFDYTKELIDIPSIDNNNELEEEVIENYYKNNFSIGEFEESYRDYLWRN